MGVGWGTKEAEKLLVKEGFKLAAKAGYHVGEFDSCWGGVGEFRSAGEWSRWN